MHTSYFDYYHTTPSRRFVKALSENGSLYNVLWPIIIDQSEKEDLDDLRAVNRFFAKHARLAKSKFVLDDYCQYNMKKTPVHLDFEVLRNVECACWGGDGLDFRTMKNFRKFCALGDVDPDEGATSFERRYGDDKETHWIFASRTRDIVFETEFNNPVLSNIPHAHYFGITGRADKLRVMFEFAKRRCEGCVVWGSRGYI